MEHGYPLGILLIRKKILTPVILGTIWKIIGNAMVRHLQRVFRQ